MKEYFDWLAGVNDTVNDFVWTKVGVWLLIIVGLLMTILTKLKMRNCLKQPIHYLLQYPLWSSSDR